MGAARGWGGSRQVRESARRGTDDPPRYRALSGYDSVRDRGGRFDSDDGRGAHLRRRRLAVARQKGRGTAVGTRARGARSAATDRTRSVFRVLVDAYAGGACAADRANRTRGSGLYAVRSN